MKASQFKVMIGWMLGITIINCVLIIILLVGVLSIKTSINKSDISVIGTKLSSIQKFINTQTSVNTANAPSASTCHLARQEVTVAPSVSSSALAALVSTCK
ncbi:hypothetical protein M1512_04510 [Patescibacteria group bacterium]|nr:hypothetical protein [Patescibacteria group bacterium]